MNDFESREEVETLVIKLGKLMNEEFGNETGFFQISGLISDLFDDNNHEDLQYLNSKSISFVAVIKMGEYKTIPLDIHIDYGYYSVSNGELSF